MPTIEHYSSIKFPLFEDHPLGGLFKSDDLKTHLREQGTRYNWPVHLAARC